MNSLFISYENFGSSHINFLLKDGTKIETAKIYGFKDALDEIRHIHKVFGVEQAVLTDAYTGEVVAEVWPDDRED